MKLPKLWSKPFWGWYIIYAVGIIVLWLTDGDYAIFDDFWDWDDDSPLEAILVAVGPLILLFAYSLIKSGDPSGESTVESSDD